MNPAHLRRVHSYSQFLAMDFQMFLDRSGAENFKYVLSERMKPGEKIVLDLEKLVNIDSYGLDALLAVAQNALENDSVIKLARVSADMQIVLDITRVYRVFDIYPTIGEAVESFKGENI